MEGIGLNDTPTHLDGTEWLTDLDDNEVIEADFGDETFFQRITQEFGYDLTLLMKNWTKLCRNVVVCNSKHKFLLKCRSNDKFPKHIEHLENNLKFVNLHAKTTKKYFQRHIKKLKYKLLSIEIEDLSIHKYYLEKRSKIILNDIRCKLPNNFFDEFVFSQMEYNKNFSKKLDLVHHKKFSNILRTSFVAFSTDQDEKRKLEAKEKWFYNLTDINIPQDVKDIVSLGPRFNRVTESCKKEFIFESIKNLEGCLETNIINNELKNEIRTVLVEDFIRHNRKSRHISREDREFAKKIKNTKVFSKTNNILFTSADKGNITVAIEKSDYIEGMNNLLRDPDTYENLGDDNPLKDLQTRTYKLMTKWNMNNYFSKRYNNKKFTQTDTSLSKIYGLPKIHKLTNNASLSNLTYRPIVSCVGSPTYSLAKTIDNMIKNSTVDPKSNLKNSHEFIEKIKHLTLPDDHVIMSIDATSLFTNISKERVIKAIERRYMSIHNNYMIPFKDFIEAVSFLIDNTFFQFDNIYYKQKYGCPMGSPLSPRLADIVLQDIEQDCLSKLDFKPLIYLRYVDDIFTIVPNDKVDYMIQVFNSCDSRLKFTHELEKDGQISFLENLVIRKGNKIDFDWYHKPTFSGRILNFDSEHSLTNKRAMVYSLVDKAILLSNAHYHFKNINLVREILVQNNYPRKFIKFHVNKRIHVLQLRNNNANYNRLTAKNQNTYKYNVVLPYSKNFFERIAKKLKRFNIRAIPKSNNNLNNIIRKGKDRILKSDMNNGVYRVKCKDCDAAYVGESKRNIDVRIKEHESKSRNKSTEFQEMYVINRHIYTNKHHFNFSDYDILDSEINWHRRTLSEMLYIHSEKFPINKKEDKQKLNKCYAPLLHKIRKNKL